VVDLGTNSTRLLVADASPDGELCEVDRRTEVTRLGEVCGRNGYRLELDACERMLSILAGIPLSQRREVVGLHPERAPTIVAGAAILVEAMRAFGLTSVEASEADILHGAALAAMATG